MVEDEQDRLDMMFEIIDMGAAVATLQAILEAKDMEIATTRLILAGSLVLNVAFIILIWMILK